MGLLVHPLVYDPEAVENLELEGGGQIVHPLPKLIHTPSHKLILILIQTEWFRILPIPSVRM